ncbi:MAG: AraC family ligand binding domain-containing protein [Syntrophaceae bacterium]|nr:AraC family ligand binding domain-containing protein [Syntrophaceae bacterium]
MEAPQAVIALALDEPDGHRIPLHWHSRAQLLYASEGVMTVTTDSGVWVLPPLRAMWIPAFTEHHIPRRDACPCGHCTSGPTPCRISRLPAASSRSRPFCASSSSTARPCRAAMTPGTMPGASWGSSSISSGSATPCPSICRSPGTRGCERFSTA